MKEVSKLTQKTVIFILAVSLLLSIGITVMIPEWNSIVPIGILIAGVVAAGLLIGKGELDEEARMFAIAVPGVFACVLVWVNVLGMMILGIDYLRLDGGNPATTNILLGGSVIAALALTLPRIIRSNRDGHTRRRYIGRLLLLIGMVTGLNLSLNLLAWSELSSRSEMLADLSLILNMILVVGIAIAMSFVSIAFLVDKLTARKLD